MLNKYIQAPYVKTPLGLATPALIISVIYLISLTIFLVIAYKKKTIKTAFIDCRHMTKSEKNRAIISTIGFVLFVVLSVILSGFLGDENILLDISKTYLKYEAVVFVLLLIFLCTAFFNNTNADVQINAINRFFHYLIWISIGTGLFSKQIDYLYWKNLLVIFFAEIINGLFFFIDIHSTQGESDFHSTQEEISDFGKFDLIPYSAVKKAYDLFPGHRDQAEDIANIITNSSAEPISICLSGKWGTGKTSIINGVAEILNNSGKKFVDTIYINALELDDKNTLLRYLMIQIRDKLKSRGVYVGVNSEYAEFVSSITGTLTTSAIGTFIQNKLSTSSDYRVQKQALELVLDRAYKNGKLVVIVDDIERCYKDTAKEYLFLVKEVATMRNCVSVFVTDYDMLNEMVANENVSTNAPDFLSKFFNHRINLRDEAPENILSFYDDFFTESDTAFWNFYKIIHKTPQVWYNEAITGLRNKLEKLKNKANQLRIEEDERTRYKQQEAQQQDCLTNFISLMQNTRNVVKFYNLFRIHVLFCEKHLHPSKSEEVARYIESRNVGQILYFLSFAEVFLPIEYEQLMRQGAGYVEPSIYGVSIIQDMEKRLLTELFQGLVFGEYSHFRKPSEYIKTDIRRFIENFLLKNNELNQLVKPFTSQEEEWRDAISKSNYQLVEKHWEEMIVMVLQKTPNEKTGITAAWRDESFLFLLEFAEKQVQCGAWTSDRLFSLFDSDKHIDSYLSLGTGLMQSFWEHIEKSVVYKKPSKERVYNFRFFMSRYAYTRSITICKLMYYLIPMENDSVKTDNLREPLLNSNNPLSQNLSIFLSSAAEAIPNFSFSCEGWYDNLKELTKKIHDYLVSHGIANYSDMRDDILHMLDTPDELQCLEKIAAWIEGKDTMDSYAPIPENHIENIDALIVYFEKGLNTLSSDIEAQREFEKKFTNFFKLLQESEGLTLPKKQLTRLQQLVEIFVEVFGISSLPYRRTILRIPEEKTEKKSRRKSKK